ncbi:hypothetical protein ZIOFF_021505 [Zingiber officinale]|uniref:Hcy-binding domain-containing protein n=1 Tax=Zingiber officinale TaxID=94328 RepID=A0A8J5LJM1_ZINOF|nr:hypothetical protein ZIOFF_021505 [Zingiber officinale]
MSGKRKRDGVGGRDGVDMEAIVWQTPANPPEASDYIFRRGKRYMRPYYFEFISHVKNRWAGKTIVDLFAEEFKGCPYDYYRPVLVVASIGSYGAYLADGFEYSGNYGQEITVETLKDFHRRRLEVLSEAGADIIAFETIPNKLEAQVSFNVFVELSNGSCSSFVAHLEFAYVELLLECDTKIPAWFSFTSKDGINVVSGDYMAECVSLADSCKKVVAIGINCTAPRFIYNLILSIKKETLKPILVYPNSGGEGYDPVRKDWVVSFYNLVDTSTCLLPVASILLSSKHKQF